MVIGQLSAVIITIIVVSSNPYYGEMIYVQHRVIKLFSDLRQDGGFRRVLRFRSSRNKIGCHDIPEILLRVALTTITIYLLTLSQSLYKLCISFVIRCA